MRIGKHQSAHLTYCLNVHPGETWTENLEAIKSHTLAVRKIVAPNTPFGLGLRLSRKAADDLMHEQTRADFKSFLAEHNLYAFTINGFPYGAFHKTRVKEAVYAPDWQTQDRIDYSIMMGKILADLLPEGIDGSISTVPGGYKATSNTPEARKQIARSLGKVAWAFEKIAEEHGKQICLGLEPEPDCLIETTDEMIAFMQKDMLHHAVPFLCSEHGLRTADAEDIVRRRIGLCLDTCHSAMQYESAMDSLARALKDNIAVPKIQISAALTAKQPPVISEQLAAFDDNVYLHQVRIRNQKGNIVRFPDLPQALEQLDRNIPTESASREWRIHCHVPLDYTGDEVLGSTGTDLTNDFFAYALQSGIAHFEIETYTFGVLPEALRTVGITKSIANEFEWVLKKLKAES